MQVLSNDVCKALEGADEDSELEVGLGNADRRCGDAGASQHRFPLDQLARAGASVPGASLRA